MERKIIQPNRVTTSKYEFSRIQKNIVYHIIGHIQDLMSKESYVYDEAKNIKISIELSTIDPNRNYEQIKEEGRKLIGKAVEYDFINNRGKNSNCVTTLISSFKHEHKSQEISIIIPSTALPFLCNIGEGFTQYRKTIALSLNSNYSMRLYELCCKWSDKEGFVMSLNDLKKMLNLENSYDKLSHFKTRVLDHAQKELEVKADVWFTYKLEKVKSRSFNVIHFKVFSNDLKKKVNMKDLYSKVYTRLSTLVLNDDNSATFHICDKIMEQGYLNRFYERLNELDDDLASGKLNGRTHLNATIRKILKEDYNI